MTIPIIEFLRRVLMFFTIHYLIKMATRLLLAWSFIKEFTKKCEQGAAYPSVFPELRQNDMVHGT